MSAQNQVRVVDLNDKKEYQRLIDGQEQSLGLKAGRVYLESQQECGVHSTEAREELLVFLSGTGTMIIGDNDTFEIGVGKIAYIPPHTPHNIKNSGSEPLVYVFCVVPV